jgi:hypothetical protein
VREGLVGLGYAVAMADEEIAATAEEDTDEL